MQAPFLDERSLVQMHTHCKLERSVSAPKRQMSSTAPRANSAHHGAILNTLGSIQPSLEVSPTAHPGSQFTP